MVKTGFIRSWQYGHGAAGSAHARQDRFCSSLPRFEADVLNLTSLVSYELRNALRITLNLSFLDYDTALINDADTG